MKNLVRLYWRIFIAPFFRENIGGFIFFYTVAILGVGHLDGEGILFYHHSLIVNALANTDTLIVVCLFWLLYMLKCTYFIARTIQRDDNRFMYILNATSPSGRYLAAFILFIILLAPIFWYGMVIVGVGLYHLYFFNAFLLLIALVALSVVPVYFIVKLMMYPGMKTYRRSSIAQMASAYPAILLRYVFEEQKVLFTTIKIFTCGVLYVFTRINSADKYDVQFPFLFFSLGILANGIIIHRIRSFEESQMQLYRSAPVTVVKRLIDYILFYLVLIVPEIATVLLLTPLHLHYVDAAAFIGCGFGMVLLMNSICFLEDFTMNEYMRAILVVLCLQYYFVVSDSLTVLFPIYFIVAILLFYKHYHLFEKRPKPRVGV